MFDFLKNKPMVFQPQKDSREIFFRPGKHTCLMSTWSRWCPPKILKSQKNPAFFFVMFIMDDDHIPYTFFLSTPKQRQKKSDAKKNINPKTQKSVEDVTQTIPWNHDINNAEKKQIQEKKHTQIIQKSLTVVGKRFFPKFKSPLQPSAVESPHCTISNWPQWYGGALGNDSTRFNWITLVEAFTHGIGAFKEMWSIMKSLLLPQKKASDIISCFSCYGSNLHTWIIFVGNNIELFGKWWWFNFCHLNVYQFSEVGGKAPPTCQSWVLCVRKNSAFFCCPKKGTKKPRN